MLTAKKKIIIAISAVVLLGAGALALSLFSGRGPGSAALLSRPAANGEVADNVPAGLRNIPAQLRDTDGDGLPDEEELSLGTDPAKADTDGDGLSDREEVKIYYSDPLKFDSLAAGAPDGETVKTSLDLPAAVAGLKK
jgi:hypothetical protein